METKTRNEQKVKLSQEVEEWEYCPIDQCNLKYKIKFRNQNEVRKNDLHLVDCHAQF